MSQLLHLADASDLPRLLPMVETFHREAGIESSAAHREGAVVPLLEGSPLGAIWMIGPKMAPVGYVCVSFGWSIELGGMDGMIDELWILSWSCMKSFKHASSCLMELLIFC